MIRKIIGWLWALVPKPAKVWVAGIAITAAIGAIVFTVYKIDERGYNRCENAHKAAAVEQKDKARGDIVKSGKAYEKVKTEIVHIVGLNDLAGPRTSHAIDSMP